MELHQLRYLVAVVDTGSFTAAAERLHVAQSGLSAQVAKLERELGCRLLDRTSRGAHPTPAGADVLVAAREALAAVAVVADAAQQHTGLLRGEVAAGLVRGGAMTRVLDPLTRFREEHPAVAVRLVEGDSDDLVAQVTQARLDLALVGFTGDGPADLRVRALLTDDLVAVVPAGHDLAGVRRPTLRRAVRDPLLLLARGSGGRAATDTALARLGLAPAVAVESSEPATLLELARRGLGVAVLSRSPAQALVGGAPDLVVVALTDVTERSCLGLVSRRGRATPAARALLERLAAWGPDPTQPDPGPGFRS